MLVLLISPSSHASSLPEFCQKNFPVLDRGRIDRDQNPVLFTGPDGSERHCLKTHQAGLEISVPATDILRFYSDVQEVEYKRAAEAFKRAMNEKVLRSLVQSMRPYEDLYSRQSCSDVGGAGRQKVLNRQRCERAQNIVPQCKNSELNAIIAEEDQKTLRSLQDEVHETIGKELVAAGHPEGAHYVHTEEQLRGAETYLKNFKKQTFLKNQVRASVTAAALIQKKKSLTETFDREMRRNDNSLSTGSFEFGDTSQIDAYKERKRVLEQNHQREMEVVQEALSRLYESNPTILNIKHSTRYLIFSNSDYELSPFSENLAKKFSEARPEFSLDENYNELSAYLNSEEAQIAFHQISERETENPSAELEELGQRQVFAELSKKREAIEMICNGEAENLHHFENLAHSLLEETSQTQSGQLTSHQAGYCYLAQREPPRDGSLPLGMTVVAGVAIVGGVAAQFIPVLGNALGGASIAYGIAALGGATLAVDSVSRYSAAVTNDAHTQTVYQGSYAWVSAEERMQSEDNRRTQRNIAVAEVALTAADALVIAKPALALLRSSIPKPAVRAAAVTPPLPVRDPAPPPTPVVVDEAPRLAAPLERLRLSAPSEAPALPAPASLDAPADISRALPPPAVAAPPRVSAAQREALEQFHRLSPQEKAEQIALIQSRLRAGQVEETEFLTMIMHTAGYSAEVFTPGPQAMALDLMGALGDKEQALRVVREFYAGKPSVRSQGRLSELEKLIDDIHPTTGTALVPVAPRVTDVMTRAPEPPVPALLTDQPEILIRLGDDAPVRPGTPELPNLDYIDGTFRAVDDVPALPRPDIEAPAGLRLTASAAADDAPRVIIPREVASAGTALTRGVLGLEAPASIDPVPVVDTTVPAPPLEIVVSLENLGQTHDSDLGFRQSLRATASVRTGEPLPSDFQFTWSTQSLAGEEVTPPSLGSFRVGEIQVPALLTAYSVIASGTAANATVIASPAEVIKQDDIQVSLSLTKTNVTADSIELEVKAIMNADLPVPEFEYVWEATGPHELSGEKLTFARREQDFTVYVNARSIPGYRISGTSDTILAKEEASPPVDEPELAPAESSPPEAEVPTWTVYIESAEVIPDTAKMKVKLKAIAEGGATLPENLSLSLEAFNIGDKEAPSMPAAKTGSEAEFEIPLIEHAYGITAKSASGETQKTGDDKRIEACFDVATAACPLGEGDEIIDSEPPLPPGQPPQRFSPLPTPAPQMFVIPGFF